MNRHFAQPTVKQENYSADGEHEYTPKIDIRLATPQDLDRLVEIDLECFEDAYREDPPSFEEMHERFSSRQRIAGDLMVVGEVNGRIEGTMACQVTDKRIEDFTSWEETTDNGYLTTTHNPSGKFFYVINLAVTPKGSEVNLSDFLVTNMYGRFVEQRKEATLLLSRIPDLSKWLQENNVEFERLTTLEQDALATEYLSATKIVEGKEVPYDGILHRMIREGSRPVRAVREGFQDPPSHNYGVLCTYEGPIPLKLRRNKVISKLAGRALIFASEHPTIMREML